MIASTVGVLNSEKVKVIIVFGALGGGCGNIIRGKSIIYDVYIFVMIMVNKHCLIINKINNFCQSLNKLLYFVILTTSTIDFIVLKLIIS